MYTIVLTVNTPLIKTPLMSNLILFSINSFLPCEFPKIDTNPQILQPHLFRPENCQSVEVFKVHRTVYTTYGRCTQNVKKHVNIKI